MAMCQTMVCALVLVFSGVFIGDALSAEGSMFYRRYATHGTFDPARHTDYETYDHAPSNGGYGYGSSNRGYGYDRKSRPYGYDRSYRDYGYGHRRSYDGYGSRRGYYGPPRSYGGGYSEETTPSPPAAPKTAVPFPVPNAKTVAPVTVPNAKTAAPGPNSPDPKPDPSHDCVRVQPDYSTHSYHQPYGVKVATCNAVASQVKVTEAMSEMIGTLSDMLTDQISDLAKRTDQLSEGVDDLKGVGKPVSLVTLANGTDARFLCQANSLVEIAEICRVNAFRIPNPAFFHLACNDIALAGLGFTCPDTSWLLEPNCLTPNTNDISSCLRSPPEDFVCQNILLISCSGFTTAIWTLRLVSPS